jgi:hypothetical protein
MDEETFCELATFFQTQRRGRIANTAQAKQLLAAIWNDLSGDDTAMTHDKVERAEVMCWDPPLLHFEVERHGGVVCGSSCASLQEWTIDIDARTKTCFEARFRQIRPMQPRLNVAKIVEGIVTAVQGGYPRKGIDFDGSDDVRIQVSLFVPSAGVAKDTLLGRRRRFRANLIKAMDHIGWSQVGASRNYRFKRRLR